MQEDGCQQADSDRVTGVTDLAPDIRQVRSGRPVRAGHPAADQGHMPGMRASPAPMKVIIVTMTQQLRYSASAVNARFAPEGAACDRCTAGCSVAALLCAPGSHRNAQVPVHVADEFARIIAGEEFSACLARQ